MRVILIIAILFNTTLKAQNADNSELNGPCKFADIYAEPPNSITSGYQIIEYPYTTYRYAPTEVQLSSPKTKSLSLTDTSQNKSIIYIFVLVF